MKRFFAPNLDRKGRLARGLMGLVLLMGAAFSLRESLWLAALLGACGEAGMYPTSRLTSLSQATLSFWKLGISSRLTAAWWNL